jgi:hypothetical protein
MGGDDGEQKEGAAAACARRLAAVAARPVAGPLEGGHEQKHARGLVPRVGRIRIVAAVVVVVVVVVAVIVVVVVVVVVVKNLRVSSLDLTDG